MSEALARLRLIRTPSIGPVTYRQLIARFGTAAAAVALSLVRTTLNGWYGQVIGQIGLLVAVIVIVRVLPLGITGWMKQRRG